jgi:hypothetical protein
MSKINKLRRFSTSILKKQNYWDAQGLKETEKRAPAPIENYLRLTAKATARLKEPPRLATMLTRDYIADSLYNPHYGYFNTHATIYSQPEVDFDKIRDTDEFMRVLDQGYKKDGQVWHTPVEIFKPWYGYAFAKYILANHDASDDLILYEIGAGNQTLMNNVLDYISHHAPQVYARTRYNIVEISRKLSQKRVETHSSKVRVINQSILEWTELITSPCFFLATEVLDNLSHDVVRYDYSTGEPYQGVVMINEDGDYSEAFEPLSDALIERYLTVRNKTFTSPLLKNMWMKQLRAKLPFAPNLTTREFVPTECFRLFEKLRDLFPRHKLVISDFDYLPEAVEGVIGPVVQTRHERRMVSCSTYLVQPGYFDIFFPTDFGQLNGMYLDMCGRGGQVMKQTEFLKRWGGGTVTRSGEDPSLEMYKNVSFFLS